MEFPFIHVLSQSLLHDGAYASMGINFLEQGIEVVKKAQ